MDKKTRDIDEYLNDLKEIKKVMDQTEDYGIIEVWVYWLYGVLITGCSLVSYYLFTLYGFRPVNIFFMVWMPMLFLCGIAETIGWVRRMEKTSTPLLSRRFTNIGASILGQAIILGVFVYYIIQTDIPHSGLYMLIGAAPIFFYSQLTYTWIIIEAFFLTGTGILFQINNIASAEGSLIAGIITGVCYIILGFHVNHLEKKSNA